MNDLAVNHLDDSDIVECSWSLIAVTFFVTVNGGLYCAKEMLSDRKTSMVQTDSQKSFFVYCSRQDATVTRL